MTSIQNRVSAIEGKIVIMQQAISQQEKNIAEILSYVTGVKKAGTFITRQFPRVIPTLASALVGAGIVNGTIAELFTKMLGL